MDNKLSVIITAYNMELYIEKCVESILNQTYLNLEIIIINDGSTDNTYKTCERLKEKDKRIKVYHIHNSGVSNARNMGLTYCSGDWVTFVDGDDFIISDTYEVLINNAIRHNVPIAVCSYRNVLSSDVLFENDYGESCIFLDESRSKEYLLSYDKGYGWSPCNKVFHKAIISNIKYDTKLSNYEDLDFLLKVYFINNPKSIFCNRRKYYYRIREESLSHKKGFTNRDIDDIEFCKNIYLRTKLKYSKYSEIVFLVYQDCVIDKLQKLVTNNSLSNSYMYDEIKNSNYIIFYNIKRTKWKNIIKLLIFKFKYATVVAIWKYIKKLKNTN